MIKQAVKTVFRIYLASWALWVLFTTVIPQVSSRLDGNYARPTALHLPRINPLQNSTIYFLMAHPDDEVMFFAPTIIQALRPENGNKVRLVCLSKGDAMEEMGPIRERELRLSGRILGIPEVEILDFKDGMNESWDAEVISQQLIRIIEPRLTIVTFDQYGVSGHPNHIDVFRGVKKLQQSKNHPVFTLNSFGFWEKYSFTLLTSVELAIEHMTKLLRKYSPFDLQISLQNLLVTYFTDLNGLALAYAAMAHGHYSQMVWFRYGWLLFSRYLNANQLRIEK